MTITGYLSDGSLQFTTSETVRVQVRNVADRSECGHFWPECDNILLGKEKTKTNDVLFSRFVIKTFR